MPAKVSAYFTNLLCELLCGGPPDIPDTLYLGLRGASGEIGTQTPAGYARVAIPRRSLQYFGSGEGTPVSGMYLTGVQPNGNNTPALFPMFTGVPSPTGATQWFMTDAATGPGNEWASGPLNPTYLGEHLKSNAGAGTSVIIVPTDDMFGHPAPGEDLNLSDFLVLGSDCAENKETVQVASIGKKVPYGVTPVTLAAPLAYDHPSGEAFSRDGITRYYSLGFVELLSASIAFGATTSQSLSVPPAAYGSTLSPPYANDPMNRLLVGLLNGTIPAPPAQWYLGLAVSDPNYGQNGEVSYAVTQYANTKYASSQGQPTGYTRQPVSLSAPGGGVVAISAATWNFTSSLGSVNSASMWFLTDAPLDTTKPDFPATVPQAGITYAAGSLLFPFQSALIDGTGDSLTIPAGDIAGLGVGDTLLAGDPCGPLETVTANPPPPVPPSTAPPDFYQLAPPSIGLSLNSSGLAPGQTVTRCQSLRVYQAGASETVQAQLLLLAG